MIAYYLCKRLTHVDEIFNIMSSSATCQKYFKALHRCFSIIRMEVEL
jgi:hypothetical protein